MLINGYTLSQFQRCERPWLIGRTHHLAQWYAPSLLNSVLRRAILDLSNGKDKDVVTLTATHDFLAEAKSPGLDIRSQGINTYTYAMDYVSIIKNFIEYLSRLTLLCLKPMPPTPISPTSVWQYLSYKDESGTLHRWDFVDYLPTDLVSELHSWEVFGDIAASDSPMTLHLVATGRRSKSHQDSPWCKIYSHPQIANVRKFQKESGNKLQGEWKPVWFSENTANKSKDWVDTMLRDNVIPLVVGHYPIKEVSAKHRDQFFKEALIEATRMEQGRDNKTAPRDVPMGRYACDKPYPCPHQLFCYGEHSLDDVGIYRRIDLVKGQANAKQTVDAG